MATYNGEIYIRDLLNSILPQLGEHDEFIISDDGSTDRTIEIVNSLADKRIRLIYNPGERGPSNNFQHALQQSKGHYIFLADQDDVWGTDKVRVMMTLLETYDLVISDAKVVNDSEEVLFESFFKERGSRKGFIKNVIRNSYIGCCMAFRKEILDHALPFPKNFDMHDWWIGMIAEVFGKVYFCPERLVTYIRHDQNASPTMGRSKLTALKRVEHRVRLLSALSATYYQRKFDKNRFA